MSAKPKRYEYHVTYDKSGNWLCRVGGAIVGGSATLARLVARMALMLNDCDLYFGQHSELIIHRKDGTIGRGSSSRRTYGGDPKGTKG